MDMENLKMLSLTMLLHTGQTGPGVIGKCAQKTMVTQTKWPIPIGITKKVETRDEFLRNISLLGHYFNRLSLKSSCLLKCVKRISVGFWLEPLGCGALILPEGGKMAVSNSYLAPPLSEHREAEAKGS